ncbi:MAG: LysR family transcriptional regulator [Burkholderiales bacterium PBB5]|nr:MAG: LysR family transcriptional regulator [Burkholderiales bacterium PBB5]
MHYTHRQLQQFLALAETGSITAAARACHVTQPTVSMQLKELGAAVGLPLFEQIGKQLHLTAAGQALARTARAMTDEWAGFEQQVAAMQGLTQGRLRVAVVSTAEYFMPRLLGSFCARHPGIEVALQVLNRDGVVARLADNRDDLAIMSMPPPEADLVQHAFLANPLVVIAPAGHPLSGRRTPLPLARLADQPFILREQGSGTRMAADAHFAAQGFEPQARLALGSNEAIKHAVAAGMGLAVISRHALADDPARDGVALLPLRGFPLHSNWFTVHRRGKRLSPIATAFLTHLQAAARADQVGSTG